MCGLAGYLQLGIGSFSTDESLLYAMQQKLKHRGPDGFGIWSSVEHEIALMHSRLSIVDLSQAAAQPMFDQERTVVLVANGEIYNYAALRKELETHHYFTSQSDSEVLIHGYKQWGIDGLLERIEGMFAFVLYDFISRDCFLVRDHIGVKPLYFSLQQNYCSFASEIKALWELPWIKKEINYEAAYHYLTYLASPAPITLFKGVYKLPAGFYIRFDMNRKMHIKQWYALHHKLKQPDPSCDEQWYVDKVASLLRASVKKMMMTDVPIGVFLSGGLDSTLIVALMSELTDKIKTFTVAFSDGPEYNELAWAAKVAKLYNTQHHELLINEDDALASFDTLIYHHDEPLGDVVSVPLYFVSKLLKDAGVTVVQVGEGSDELFCGYDSYVQYMHRYRWWHSTQRYIPAVMRQSLFYATKSLYADKYNRLDVLNNWASNKEPFYSGAVVCSEYMKELLCNDRTYDIDPMTEQFFPGMRLVDSYAMADWYRTELQRSCAQADVLTQMGYLELKHRLPELLLMRIDKMGMAAGVEARVPFLDHHLVEFALTVPQELKYHRGITKYVLKKVAERLLPKEIVYRKKMGFAAPVSSWFKKSRLFNERLHDMLATKSSWSNLLHIDFIRDMQRRNRVDDGVDYSYQLWAIQNVIAYGD